MTFTDNGHWNGLPGIWKPAGETLVIYDQTICDAYSCTWVSVITALSNLMGLQLTDNQLKDGWAEFVATGKFIPGFGAAVIDSAPHALAYFNRVTGSSCKGFFDRLTPDSIVNHFSNGCGATFGLKVGPQFIADGQDNAVIDNPNADAGSAGHAVTLIKVNTMDQFNCKYLDNYRGRVYEGKPFNNVVLFKLPDAENLMQNFLYVVSK